MGPLRRTARGLSEGFRSLGESPRELWLIYAAKFFESVGIFSTLLMLTLWLSNDLGYTDQGAGWWAGTFSLALSAMTFVIGFFADWLGFRRALIIGFTCSVVARGCMSLANTRWAAISSLMFLSIGMVLSVHMRRFS